LQISQGLKAGLAAGVVYGLFIGILHLVFLDVCSSTQLAYIAHRLATSNPPSTEKATDDFANVLVVFPIYWGLGSMLLGLLYGVAFAVLYRLIPGTGSKRKGLLLGIAVFMLGPIWGVSGLEVGCTPGYVSFIALGISLPVSLAFGYLLGVFYDSFGRLAIEQKEDSRKGGKGVTVQ
jgi:hypothetical protein